MCRLDLGGLLLSQAENPPYGSELLAERTLRRR
jgi:hypothetical protein